MHTVLNWLIRHTYKYLSHHLLDVTFELEHYVGVIDPSMDSSDYFKIFSSFSSSSSADIPI